MQSQHTQPSLHIYGWPWIYHAKSKPAPWATPVPSPGTTSVPTSQEHTCSTPKVHQGTHLCLHPDQCHCLEEQHLLVIKPNLSLSLSLNHNLSLFQYQILMRSELSEPPHQIHPQLVTQYPTTESSLSLDTQQAWEMGCQTTQVHLLCASDEERTITQRTTARNEESVGSIVRASNMHPVVVHSYPELPQLQMGRLQTQYIRLRWAKPVSTFAKFAQKTEKEVKEPRQTEKCAVTATSSSTDSHRCTGSTISGE